MHFRPPTGPPAYAPWTWTASGQCLTSLPATRTTRPASGWEIGKQVRRTDKRVASGRPPAEDAVKHIGRLPAPGEAYHLVTAKRYSLWNVVQAVLQLAAPATIAYFGVATLGFSKQNLEELLALLDSGQIAKVDFLFSVYFKSNEKEICQRLAHELTTRGHRVVAMFTHAKIMLLELIGRPALRGRIVGQLRIVPVSRTSCWPTTRQLFDFHRQWLTEVLEAEEMSKSKTKAPAAKAPAVAPPATWTPPPPPSGPSCGPSWPSGRTSTRARSDALAAYCLAYSRWTEAEGKITELGSVIKSPAGFAVPSPYLAVAKDAQRAMRQWAAELRRK